MIFIKRLASALCLALCFSAYSNAQVPGTIDPATGLVTYETSNALTPSGWNGQQTTVDYGGTNPRELLGCCSGGPGALVDPSGGSTIWFAYSSSTVSQTVAINQALAGSGIQVSGINYGFQYYNQDYNRGTLFSTLSITNNNGALINSVTTQHGTTTAGWTPYSNSISLNNASITTLGTATLSFTGSDDRFWAGYYGPAVSNPYVRFTYTVDPCATNPAYSPSCSGFNAVITSANVVPYPNASASWGSFVNNSYAIQTALSEGGSGLKVHGFDWGYRVHSSEPYCAFWALLCFDNRDPLVRTAVSITNKNNTAMYSVVRDYNDINNPQNFNYSYRFQTSQNLGDLGSFNFTAQTWDNASISDMYSRIVYTPDLCMIDPLSSPLCPNYFQALASSTTQSGGVTEQNITDTVTTTPTNVSAVEASYTTPTATQTTEQPVADTVTVSSSPSNTLQQASTSSASQTTPTPTVSNPQPKVGEVAQSSAPKSTVSLSTILNVISAENSRLSTVERTAVENTTQQATSAAQSSSQQAETIASNLTTQSITSSSQSLQQTLAGQTNNVQGNSNLNASINVNSGASMSSSSVAQNNISSKSTSQEDKTNNNNVSISETQTEKTQSSVNQKVKDNDLAGGVTIASINTQPIGFEAYMSSMKDGQFYPPKEIYKGQQNVDNARLLRGLTGGSDKLHEQMMGLQYK